MIIHKSYDIFIVSAEKDYNKLPYVIRAARENLRDFTGEMVVVTPTALPMSIEGVRVLRHEEVLPIDRTRFPHRPNWTFQQFLKLFQHVTTSDSYLVIDADIIINRPLSMLEGSTPLFYLGIDQLHPPYFDFMQKIVQLRRSYDYTFINEFMLMNRPCANS